MSKQKRDLIIRIALFTILGFLLLALVWDRLAKGGSDAAFAKVEELINQQHLNTEAQGMIHPEDVHAAIGSPSTKEDHGHYLLETFSWRRGNPFSTYFVNVIYTKRQGQWQLYIAFLNEVPVEDDLSQQVGTGTMTRQPTSTDADKNNSPEEGGDQAGGEVRKEAP